MNSAFCTDEFCPAFGVRKYLGQLRERLPRVPPVDIAALRSLHAVQDHKGIVRLIKRLMNIEAVTFQIFWVPDGAAQDRKHAAAWVELPEEMPLYGSKEFNEMTIKMFFRRSFLRQAYDEAAFVIAHEFSHVVLESIRHPLRKCEKAVDLTAMLLGFGRVYQSACYKETREGNRIKFRSMGYLSRDQVREANALLESERAPPPDKPARTIPSIPINAKKLLTAAVMLAALCVVAVGFGVTVHNDLAANQAAMKRYIPLKISDRMTLTSTEVGLTNLTMMYRVALPRENIDFVALQREEVKRLCTTKWWQYEQEYRDRSGNLVGRFKPTCP
jgi:hypothetical protein